MNRRKEDLRSYISELSEEINATQRAVAALQKTSTTILAKLERVLKERERPAHVEVGYQ